MSQFTRQPMNFDAAKWGQLSRASPPRAPHPGLTPLKPDPKKTAQDFGEVGPKQPVDR